MKMALDNYLPVLILLSDYVKDSSQYPLLQKGLQGFSPADKPPVYSAHGANTVVTADLPRYLVDILRGHTLVRRIYESMIPARDYERINPGLHPMLEQWDIQCLEAAQVMR